MCDLTDESSQQSVNGEQSKRSHVSRRQLLRGLGTVGTAVFTSLSGCLFGGNDEESSPSVFASQQGRITQEQATHVVTTARGLRNAVSTPNAVVWIPNNTVIDISGEFGVEIARNVMIASNRDLAHPGGMLESNAYINGHFTTKETGNGFIRISGIRLKGPRTDVFDPRKKPKPASAYYSAGFRLAPKKVLIDNCEVVGWTNAGFLLGSKQVQTTSWLHHNQMHHNRMHTLGYPFELYNGTALIEWNYFNANRHSITAFGSPTSGYEARFNLVGSDAVHHAFDMHALCENRDAMMCGSTGRDLAGKFCNIHHNVFLLTHRSAFSIQGYSVKPSQFVSNWCAEQKGGSDTGDPEGVVYFPDYAAVTVRDNRYGKEAVAAGQEWLSNAAQKVAASAPGQSVNPPADDQSNGNTTAQKHDPATFPATTDPLTGTTLTTVDIAARRYRRI
ncbi:hypothetical protein ACFQL7_27600 [Halocatena marina]|uniref:Right handed beta helix domain-containing protein n=1 Tax=Halocatena marina TaxID=2934937 RepID=A0ABD5YWE6_9EURY